MNELSPAVQLATRTVSYSTLHRFVVEAFRRAGLADADARTDADALATTDAWGIFTHGTKNVRGYLRCLKAEGLRATGRPRLAAEGPAWGIADGDSALGLATSVLAMQTSAASC